MVRSSPKKSRIVFQPESASIFACLLEPSLHRIYHAHLEFSIQDRKIIAAGSFSGVRAVFPACWRHLAGEV